MKVEVLPLLGVALATLVLGCGAFTNLDGFSDGVSDAGTTATEHEDGSNGSADATDAAPPVIGPSCGNGVCALAPPPGWTYAAVRFGEGADCPDGYSSGTDLVEMGQVPAATCNCSCGAPTTVGSCTTGDALYRSGVLCPTIFEKAIIADGSCAPAQVAGNTSLLVKPPKTAQGSCAATVGTAKPPPPPQSPARSCSVTAMPTSEGCEANRRCVPVPTGSYGLCITRSGSGGGGSACPEGYTRRRNLGTGITDTRSCASCTCETTDTCQNAKLELFTSAGCSGSPALVAVADEQCKSLGGSGNYTYGRYSATRVAGAACKVTREEVTGRIALDAPVTVCCPASGNSGS